MTVPICQDGTACGSLTCQRQGLYTVLRGEMHHVAVSRLYGVFEGGEIPLGIPVPEGNQLCLQVSVPTSRLPGGRLLRGILRAADWAPWPGGKVGAVTLPACNRNGSTFRFLWKPGEALPCEALLCFYSLVEEAGNTFLELTLDDRGRPVV